MAIVTKFLAHRTSAITPVRYDNQKLENLQAAAARLERGETFDPAPRQPASLSNCQVFVKNETYAVLDNDTNDVSESAVNCRMIWI